MDLTPFHKLASEFPKIKLTSAELKGNVVYNHPYIVRANLRNKVYIGAIAAFFIGYSLMKPYR